MGTGCCRLLSGTEGVSKAQEVALGIRGHVLNARQGQQHDGSALAGRYGGVAMFPRAMPWAGSVLALQAADNHKGKKSPTGTT